MKNTGTDKTFIIEGIHFQTKEPISVRIQNGVIAAIQPNPGARGEMLSMIAPGLVDMQINGYGGIDFNTLPTNDEVILTMTRAMWKEGVTSYFPTVITNSQEGIEEAVHSIAKACTQDKDCRRGIAGIHLEGPFISPEDGPRGAHNKSYVRPPDWSIFQRWQDAAEGRIKIITISPEWEEAPEFIVNCVENGVTVSIGHTAASPNQIREAVRAGARMSTHLGNGAHLMIPRHPNYIWEQLAQDELWACVIADGFHLPDSVLKVTLRTKGERIILVSDAVSLSGMPAGEYDLHIGGKVVLTSKGKLHMAENPRLLAGSAQMLISGIEHMARSGLTDLSTAWEMASLRPSSFMNLPTKHGLKVGAPADLVVFHWDGENVSIEQTIKAGRVVLDHCNQRDREGLRWP